VTVLSPQIGYENATKVARYAQQNNCTVRKAVIDLKLMSEKEFDSALGDLISLAKRKD
jgi:fumarate hydratase class II